MRKKKIIKKAAVLASESFNHDPFLRRIQLQGSVLKKMLAEVDQSVITENELNTEDEMNPVILENEENDEQK